jgi:CheY-like chemotaxis protein
MTISTSVVAKVAKRVLVVEDDPDYAAQMAFLLRRGGYDVEMATDGLSAIACIERGNRPAVIILDMMMPVMDGPAFLSRRSADPLLLQTPVIAVSGTERAAHAGVQAFLQKPFDPEQLLEMVRLLSA